MHSPGGQYECGSTNNKPATTVARKYPLALRRESLFIDLTKVDMKDLEESMAKLIATAMEIRCEFVLKKKRIDALQPLSNSSSHMVGSESTMDVKPSVADV